jgi:hypothetical protein
VAKIEADRDSLSCLSNVISLEGSNIGDAVNNLTYHWFTFDGIIDTDPSDFIIDISAEPGKNQKIFIPVPRFHGDRFHGDRFSDFSRDDSFFRIPKSFIIK